jgi:carbonic anhydrase
MWLIFSLFAFFGYAITPSEALTRLLDGNRRYAKDEAVYPNHSTDRREAMKEGQSPFAVILGCSDSRVSPEIIFDQGLGDLFIVRVAGNVVGPVGLDSLEYGVKNLGGSVLLVLGHEGCGAVTAVYRGQTAGIEAISDLIKPAIEESESVESAIKDNIRFTVNHLKSTAVIGKLIKEGKLKCLGGYYHLGTGTIELL